MVDHLEIMRTVIFVPAMSPGRTGDLPLKFDFDRIIDTIGHQNTGTGLQRIFRYGNQRVLIKLVEMIFRTTCFRIHLLSEIIKPPFPVHPRITCHFFRQHHIRDDIVMSQKYPQCRNLILMTKFDRQHDKRLLRIDRYDFRFIPNRITIVVHKRSTETFFLVQLP